MKVLITGGFGFVGQALTKNFIESGAEVHVLDNMTGISPLAEPLLDKVHHHAIDITDSEGIKACFLHTKPNLCIHLAAMHYIPACNAHPVKAHTVNVTGTLNILDGAEKAQVSHCIILSSGAIYADSRQPLNECTATINPTDIYGLTKWQSEQLTQYYATKNQAITYTILRLFNVFGPGETNPHILPEIIEQLRQGNTLRLGNIQPQRDFIHVEDAAQAICSLAFASNLPHMGIFNVCSGKVFSMAEIIQMIAQITGRNIEIEADPAKWRTTDKICQMGDPSLLSSQTGFKPTYSFEQGLYHLLRAENII